MAFVATAATAEYLPLLLLGGFGAFVATRKGAQAPPRKDKSQRDRFNEQYQADLEDGGAVAGFFQSLNNKTLLMGSYLNHETTPNLQQAVPGYVPDRNFNPLDSMNRQHMELADFDRADTFLALDTGIGEVRMRKRNAMFTPLTSELHHPKNPAQMTTFAGERFVPNWANDAQIKKVRHTLHRDMRDSEPLMKYYGVEYFNRAPGQSFRYEG